MKAFTEARVNPRSIVQMEVSSSSIINESEVSRSSAALWAYKS